MTEFVPNEYRILVVDDSAMVLRMVEASLRDAGFQVMAALSGEEALEIMQAQGLPHLALVDINMPLGMDGFELCEQILEFSDLPVIMLTAVDESGTITEAIDKYAEDYITKPFRQGELVARVRRVLRRIGGFAYPLAQYTRVDDNLSVNFAQGVARVSGTEVSLTPAEMKLLYILMRAGGQTLTISFIMRRLWPSDYFSATDERLRVYIHRLRNKIEADPTQPRYVISRRGKGYSFGETL